MATIVDEIKKIVKTDKAIVGTNETIKALKTGRIAKVFVTSNCPAEVRKDIGYYAGLSKAEIVELPIPNDELGVVCRKPFLISVLGVLK
jgi:large subunit ribosomal protein L30e